MAKLINNSKVNSWIEEMKKIANPREVVYITGDKKQKEALTEEALAAGEIWKLNQKKYPGCYLRRSNPNDVARAEKDTYICCSNQKDAGPLNNWKAPDEMKEKLFSLMEDCMEGKTMYVIPYSMGVVGTPFAKYGIEITDSRYVVLSMMIMARCGQDVIDIIKETDDVTRGFHSICTMDENERYICHFTEENEIYSLNSEYGGNVLQGKKCLALRIASVLAKEQGWMAEHMAVIKVERRGKEPVYIGAAFPSACGKTNFAMMIPPEYYRKKGVKISTISDDIGWLVIGEDGRLCAINPEKGFFGVAPGTNAKTNLNALETTYKDTMFTNVALNLDENTPWWKALEEVPKNALDWQGNKWDTSILDDGSHPNSRFASPIENCPCIAEETLIGTPVPLSVIIVGGRSSSLKPLVYQSPNWKNGVFMASSMSSETTAATVGKIGVPRRDPMAMGKFMGYHVNEYFTHWLFMGEKLGDKAPIIVNVNWFRKNKNGDFLWQGFGENFRVVEWAIEMAENPDSANKELTPIGYIPKSLNLHGMEDVVDMDALFEINKELWLEECNQIEEFYKENEITNEVLLEELNNLRNRLIA